MLARLTQPCSGLASEGAQKNLLALGFESGGDLLDDGRFASTRATGDDG
jgi:hypothetical protein